MKLTVRGESRTVDPLTVLTAIALVDGTLVRCDGDVAFIAAETREDVVDLWIKDMHALGYAALGRGKCEQCGAPTLLGSYSARAVAAHSPDGRILGF